ncbi:MAG: acyl-CoA carboxylase subunit beta [Pseudomonadales bacterium]|nr:acyl-CoA carboxylase subunit beta [Pseudomonadales bacterium]
MPRINAKVLPSQPQFVAQRSAMLERVAQLRDLEARAMQVSNKRLPTFAKRGQLAPAERLARLLDPGMPFLRLHSLANYLYEDSDAATSIPGASIIAGIGFVSGVRCMVWVDDSGIRAGAYTKATVDTSLSLQAIALRQKLPLVHLVESAGANLMDFTVENWIYAGSVFRNLAYLSAAGIPTVTVLHGASTAGGAYMPGLSDYVIGVKNNGLAALGGAALVRAATGEIADERELGGSEMHASVSGLVEYLADDDAHGIALAREVVGRLNWQEQVDLPPREAWVEPHYAPDELAGAVPVDYKTPYDVREVLARLADDSVVEEFKSRYGPATVCVHASIMGYSCGIIGNNGPIDPAGATKAAQFFQLCDQSNTPLIFLHNTTGYIVGTKSEQAGMIKHGSKMVQAVSNVRVPKISMYIGASFGAGNYGMCGFGYEPDFLFAWPNAATNVMGGEQAAKTMTQVAEAKAERTGQPLDREAIKAQEQKIIEHFAREENVFYSAGRNLSHAVIDPRDSRQVLGFALETCMEARARTLRPNSFGVARM